MLAVLPPEGARRRLVALAGPPAGGKSTLAAALSAALAARGESAVVVPMDGFHLDNAVLRGRGLLSRKGAPETFDAEGFIALVTRLRQGAEVAIPLFDRQRDIAVAGAAIVPADCRTVIVEGNYLLFDAEPWRRLAALWDLAVFLEEDEGELAARLVQRWRDHGLDARAARQRAEANDLPNARRILSARLPATLVL
ncbi:MAG: nucleoside/nucleotide kinase family protein [Defluviimonas sp.]|nr:nucleoside/nucleotide kinase family protein [Paracoccaceae bacterium]MCC0065144.1 nucleoside/nucleotide kinase family protein [Defluviimonas sp.]